MTKLGIATHNYLFIVTGHVMPNWKRRYFELQGSTLIYKKTPNVCNNTGYYE
jgi:hypothetical protein